MNEQRMSEYRHALLAITGMVHDENPAEVIFAGLTFFSQMAYDLAPEDLAERTIAACIASGKEASEAGA